MGESEEILYPNCDCLYDFGPIYRRQAAAYFKLNEILNGKSMGVRSL